MPITIAWNFRYMCTDDNKFPCTWELLQPYLSRLYAFEGCTRAEIEGHKNSNHGWKTDKGLTKEMREKARNIPVLRDKRLSQLELSRQCRAFGFYQDNIFCFVFLDKEHEGYSCQNR